MSKKTTTENVTKYVINICGKRREVTKEEFEKRYPSIVETESTETATTE